MRKTRGRSKPYFTQWAAQFFVGAELTRRGYVVSYPLGNAPVTDLQVTSPKGHSFSLEVKGLKSPNWWIIKRPPSRGDRYYVLALVLTTKPFVAPRYFVLSAAQLRKIHDDGPTWPGLAWRDGLPYEGRWETLPR